MTSYYSILTVLHFTAAHCFSCWCCWLGSWMAFCL